MRTCRQNRNPRRALLQPGTLVHFGAIAVRCRRLRCYLFRPAQVPVHSLRVRRGLRLVLQGDWRVELLPLDSGPRLYLFIRSGCSVDALRVMTAHPCAAGLATCPYLTLDTHRRLLQFLALDTCQLISVDPEIIIILGVQRSASRIRLAHGDIFTGRSRP